MKKILILSERFYPYNSIGCIRPTKLAKYLIMKGYEVDIITQYAVPSEYKNILFHNMYFYNKDTSRSLKVTNTRQTSSRGRSLWYKKLSKIFHTGLCLVRSLMNINKLKRIIEYELKGTQYDTIISSFGPLTSLFLGMYYKKTYPKVRWICDFRDPVVNDDIPQVFHPYYKYLQNRACKKADIITTVSNGYLCRICGKKYFTKAYMIPNGFDTDDLIAIKKSKNNTKLTFAYAGLLYGGKRDLSPLFRAIRELIEENCISQDNICLQYAGRDFQYLLDQAYQYNLESILLNKGQLTHQESLDFQNESDILILATWNDKKEIGVFPGKFLEYMLMKKPIISIITGPLSNSEVKRVMQEGNFGVTLEQATFELDLPLLKNYIKYQYKSFITEGKVHFNPLEEVLERYNWNNIIEEIEKIL